MATEEELLAEEARLLERKQELLRQRQGQSGGKPGLLKRVVGGVGEGVGQGLSFGFIDELAAGLAATVKSPFSERTFGEIYNEQLDIERGNLAGAREHAPYITGTSEFGGAVLQGGALLKGGTALVGEAVRRVPLLARLIGVGAAEGALYGAGSSEEGERIEGAAMGGGVGAVAGPVGYGTAKVAGKALHMAAQPIMRAMTNTPTRQAERIVSRAMEADDLSLPTVRAELERLGPNATIADLGENLSATARGATARTGSARTIASNLLNDRQTGQQSRLLSAAGGEDFDVGDFKASFARAMTQRQSQAAPLYEKAYATSMQMTDQLKALIKRPALKNALQRALTIVKDEGITTNGEVGHVRVMDAAKQELDDQIGSALRNGERNTARRLLRIKNELLAEVDAQVPEYKQARELFSSEASLRDAGSLGRSVLTTRVDMEAAEIAVEAMTEGERHAFRMGAIRGLIDKLEGTPETRNAAGKLVESVRARDLLKMAFPDQAALDRFIRTAEAESQFSFTRNRVMGGSPTARIQEDVRALDQGSGVLAAMAQGRDAVGVGLQLLKKMGMGDASEETLNEVARILFSRDMPDGQLARIVPRPARPSNRATRGASAAGSAVAATSYLTQD